MIAKTICIRFLINQISCNRTVLIFNSQECPIFDGNERNSSMFIFDKKSIRESKWEQKVIVHEIVVSLRIPPCKEKSFNEDDEISIDTCLLLVLFQERESRRTTILWRSKFEFLMSSFFQRQFINSIYLHDWLKIVGYVF